MLLVIALGAVGAWLYGNRLGRYQAVPIDGLPGRTMILDTVTRTVGIVAHVPDASGGYRLEYVDRLSGTTLYRRVVNPSIEPNC